MAMQLASGTVAANSYDTATRVRDIVQCLSMSLGIMVIPLLSMTSFSIIPGSARASPSIAHYS